MDTQSVLVFPVEGTLIPLPSEPLNAVVTSTDLTTGEVRVWKDSLTVDPSGIAEHVFWSEFTAEHGHRYRIEVERSDGARSHVEVLVPPEVTVLFDESEGLRQKLYVEPDGVKLLAAEIQYAVRSYMPGGSPRLSFSGTVSHEGRGEEGVDGWALRISLSADYGAIKLAFLDEHGSLLPGEGLVLCHRNKWVSLRTQ